jgi:hypothetical protein
MGVIVWVSLAGGREYEDGSDGVEGLGRQLDIEG